METQNELENAQKKLTAKGLDVIVLNSLREKGAGFGHDTNKVTLIDSAGEITELPLQSKKEVAQDIFQKLISLLMNHK